MRNYDDKTQTYSCIAGRSYGEPPPGKEQIFEAALFRAIPRDPVIMMSTISLKLRTADVSIRFKAHCIFMA